MVSIIILSYNTKDLLRECLEAIFSSVKSVKHEVIVLDNASSDDSAEMVKRHFSKTIVIESKENLGFARGINVAAKKAKGEYLLFLNSDAILKNDSLSQMVEFFHKDDTVAVVGGNLLNRDGATSEPYGKFYHLPEVIRLLFFAKKASMPTYDDIASVDWVSGGFMLIKKSIFAAFEGFDEHFFMYMEDMELCFRLKRSGYKVLYDSHSVAKHVGQGSSNRTFAVVNIFRGILYFYKKNKPAWEYYVVKCFLFVKALFSYGVGIAKNSPYLRTTYSQALSAII